MVFFRDVVPEGSLWSLRGPVIQVHAGNSKCTPWVFKKEREIIGSWEGKVVVGIEELE